MSTLKNIKNKESIAKVLKFVIWIPGLFWLFPAFLACKISINSWGKRDESIANFHALYSGLQIFFVICLFDK